jgi:hypothetical protein
MKAFWTAIQIARDNRGSAESALVIVPLLVLFLIGMQISLVTHSRNVGRMKVQDEASIRAISGEFQEGDDFIHIESSGDGQNLDLLVSHREATIQNLLPTFLNEVIAGRGVSVDGIAIVENGR